MKSIIGILLSPGTVAKSLLRPLVQFGVRLSLPEASLRRTPTQVISAFDWAASQRQREGVSYTEVIPQTTISVPLPGAPSRFPEVFASHSTWVQPSAFVSTLPLGRVWGRRGAVLTDDSFLVGNVSREFGAFKGIADKRHPIFRQLRLPPPTHLQGEFAVIATPGSRNYFHWLFDCLPRLHLLKMAGLFDRIDGVIADYEGLPFQRESLDTVGLTTNRLVVPDIQWRTHFQVDSLVVPSLPSELGTIADWVVSFLRATFLESAASRAAGQKKRLYISRRNAPSRRESNYEEVLAFLRARGFEEYLAEDHSIAETAHDFANAEWIVGMHGAGLCNVVFASPQTRVVEFFPPQHADPLFWILSHHTRCSYGCLIADGAPADSTRDLVARKVDVDVAVPILDLARVMDTLEKA